MGRAKNIVASLALLLALLPVAGNLLLAQPAGPAGDQQITLEVGGQKRTCLVHLPPLDVLGAALSNVEGPPAQGAARPLPLVIAFHGSRGNGKGMAGTTGFDALADKHGFIAAYPDAIVEPRTWNALFGRIPGGAGVQADDVDDVAFVRSLIALLHKSYHTDPNRVFVCGFSAGAYMAYRLAVELSDQIAAAGIVNGSLGIKSVDGKPAPATIPQPVAPISLIHICGKKDRAVKFEGAQTPKNLFKSIPDCIQFFVKADGCAPTAKETKDAEHGVIRTRYSGGEAGTEVELVVVENCGHAWPTDRQGLSTSQALWDFFSTHPKGVK